MRYLIYLLILIIIIPGCSITATNDFIVSGVEKPVILLNGVWSVNADPEIDYWKNGAVKGNWKTIQVPGELMMQGIVIKHDQPFLYKKSVQIPKDFSGKRIMLQFEGVYSYARVWVNGIYIRDHSGGFTSWECDITEVAKPGETCFIWVEVTDKADEISYASGYAKHQIGGILRDVKLMALPMNYPDQISITTDFDDQYSNAQLRISGHTKMQSKDGIITVKLTDPKGNNIKLRSNKYQMSGSNNFEFSFDIRQPKKWDSEHPELYNLVLCYYEEDTLVWQKCNSVGFREIKIDGNSLYVNGDMVKLRGACRHDIHPLLGRVSTPEYELRDVLLAKEANMNFIRTSHYPPTENFLKLCDEYGLYVEDETAVCFVGSHRTEIYYPGSSESDTAYTGRYMSQLKEMVMNHKNHPSVIIWSIGNENSFGENFLQSYQWVKQNDPTRPVIFSYPGHVPEEETSYDILSMHYPGIDGTMNQIGKQTNSFGFGEMPVIFDEWAHVACYNNQTVKEDPNIRDFWGISLDSMWLRTYGSNGGLGGAIWGMIDETFMLPDTLPGFNEWWGIIDEHVIPAEYSGHTVGYGEWGIIDTWRRKKPEFWNTKKAYSPVRILKTAMYDHHRSSQITVPVYNRFNHTNLNELEISYIYKGKKFILKPTNINPHSKGELKIPVKDWDENETIRIQVSDKKGHLIDMEEIQQGIVKRIEPNKQVESLITIKEQPDDLVISCGDNTGFKINKLTGLIEDVIVKGSSKRFYGPLLNLRVKGDPVIYSYHEIDDYATNWQMESMEWNLGNNTLNITTSGNYSNNIRVTFHTRINADGKIDVSYHVKGLPHRNIRELGVQFILSDCIDSISWSRNPYWSYYPPGHISAKKGSASVYPKKLNRYREIPEKEWKEDSKSFYYFGTENESDSLQLSNNAKASKENIFEYNLFTKEVKWFSVIGPGDVDCRLSKMNNDLVIHINNKSDYVDLSWGNYQRNILIKETYSDSIALDFQSLK